jgi:O-antigen/teichoic acid export membrane protein
MLNKEFVLISFGRAITAVVGLVAIRVMTTYLPVEQYGHLALLTAIQTFCGLFLVNPIGQYINLNTHAWFDEKSLLARLQAYRMYLLLVSIVAGITVFFTMRNSVDQIQLTILVLFFLVMAVNWNNTLIPLLNMLGGRSESVIWSIVTVIFGLIASVALVLWRPTAESWLAGQVLGMSIGLLGARYVLHKQLFKEPRNAKVSLIDRKTIFTYCLPLAVATGFMWLSQSGYRFVIEHFWGLAQLSFFVVGFQVAAAMWSIVEAVAMQFLYPYFFRRVTNEIDATSLELAYSDLMNCLMPVYIVLTGALIICAPYLLKLLVADRYQSALEFLMLGAIVELCRVLANVMSNAAHVKRKTEMLTPAYAMGAIFVIGGAILVGLIDQDLIWVAYTMVGGSIMMLLVMGLSMYFQIRFALDLKRWSLALTLFVLMISLSSRTPEHPSFWESVAGLVKMILPVIGMLILLLYRNPALERLINVKLIKNEKVG